MERGGGAPAAFLNRVPGEFEGDPAGVPNAILHASSQSHVDAAARRKIAAGLRDADHRARGLQLLTRDAVVAESFNIDGCFTWLGPIVKPDFAAQPFGRVLPGFAHGKFLWEHASWSSIKRAKN